MANYYRESGLSWRQYLQANSFVKEINGTIRKSGEQIGYKISDQTKQIVAGNQALSRNFQAGFDKMGGTLEEGFGMIDRYMDRLNQDLYSLNIGIERLGAAFEYGMSLLCHQLEVQNQQLGEIVRHLEAIDKKLATPTLTQAREFYNIGRERLRKGLLEKALESFLKAEEKNDADFLIQYSIGHLYLYGKNTEVDVIDIPKVDIMGNLYWKRSRCLSRGQLAS